MKRIALSGRRGVDKFAIVDDENYECLSQWKWYLDKYGYAMRPTLLNEGKKTTKKMHRVITNCPNNKTVDHLDGNRLNNQKSNLRICTRRENVIYQKRHKNNTSGYKGVYFRHKTHIHAQIMINRKNIILGRFPDLISAAKAYDKKAKELFGEYALLNFPD